MTKAQSEYIATNEISLEAARERPEAARPFLIYADGQAVGFTMSAYEPDDEDPDSRYWLWRFMIGGRYQGRGYGKEALNRSSPVFKITVRPTSGFRQKKAMSRPYICTNPSGSRPAAK